ncbi:MAG: endonuclease III [Limisphaerales bacterium]
MPRESAPAKATRVSALLARLDATYPDAHCELHFSSPLELLVATILSAQCTDQRVNLVTTKLFQTYRTAKDYALAPLADLESAIRSTGFFRNKARNIQVCCQALLDRHGGEVPRSMVELTALAGVGRKTANVLLGNAFGMNEGVVVDTHVARLTGRLGLSPATTPENIESHLVRLVPREQWTQFSHWLIWHGRRRCNARKPDCIRCEIRDLCPSAGNAR